MLASALSLTTTPLCAIEICSKLALVAPWGARGAWGDERENAQATCQLASGALQISPQLHLGSCISGFLRSFCWAWNEVRKSGCQSQRDHVSRRTQR